MKAAQKALGTSAEAGLAGAGKNAVSSQQGLGKKLLDGIDNLKSTGKALLKDEGGFLDLDALAGKKSVSGAVGKSGTSSIGRMDLAGKTHPVSGVKFDSNGFPIFESKYNTKLDPQDYLKSRGTPFETKVC